MTAIFLHQKPGGEKVKWRSITERRASLVDERNREQPNKGMVSLKALIPAAGPFSCMEHAAERMRKEARLPFSQDTFQRHMQES